METIAHLLLIMGYSLLILRHFLAKPSCMHGGVVGPHE
jgi:hypothetical protein